MKIYLVAKMPGFSEVIELRERPKTLAGNCRIFEGESEPTSAEQDALFLSPEVPKQIENWRARTVLLKMGLLDSVNQIINAMTGDEGTLVRTAWEAGASLERTSPTVNALAATLSLSTTQVDTLFIQAAALKV